MRVRTSLQFRKDIGLVSFSEDLAPAVAKSSQKRKLIVGQKIKMVGYGKTNTIDDTGTGRKNMGENNIQSFKDNLAYFYGYASDAPKGIEPGIISAVRQGDSGGAVFNQRDELIGIIVGGKVYNKNPSDAEAIHSVIVNIRHPDSETIMNDIKARNCRGEYLEPNT